MSDEIVKWMFSMSVDNFMGLNVVWKLKENGKVYRWYYRRFWTVEILWD